MLVTLYLSAIVSANATAAKLFDVFGVYVTAGALAIPLVYLTTDMLNELYGEQEARRVVWMGALANTVLVVMTQLCMVVPRAPIGASQAAFAEIFHSTPRVVVASMVAYLLSSLLDVWVFARIRDMTGEPLFWLRKNGSTAISQGVDSLLFVGVAFGGTMPVQALLSMALGQYLVKIVAAPLGTPFTYVILKIARGAEIKKGSREPLPRWC